MRRLFWWVCGTKRGDKLLELACDVSGHEAFQQTDTREVLDACFGLRVVPVFVHLFPNRLARSRILVLRMWLPRSLPMVMSRSRLQPVHISPPELKCGQCLKQTIPSTQFHFELTRADFSGQGGMQLSLSPSHPRVRSGTRQASAPSH